MDDMDEIIKEFTTKNDVESALDEKAAGEFISEESIGEIVKDYPRPQKEIDLHQMTGSEGQVNINNFIQTAKKQNLRTVRVITGKGSGVILETAERLLGALKKDGEILAFRKEKTGGSFIVYLS
jgi:DNA-nicking Smr family endonuclease